MALSQDRARLAERSNILATEINTLPGDGELRQAHAAVVTLADEARRLAERRSAAETRVAAARTGYETAHTELIDGASEVGLPTDPTELSDVEHAIGRYRVAGANLWSKLGSLHDLRRAADDAADDSAAADDALTDLAERAAVAAEDAEAAQERHRTLASTVGAAVADLERQLAELTGAVQSNRHAARAAQRAADEALERKGNANGIRKQLDQELHTATEERAQATESFQRYAHTGLLTLALPELSLPPAPWSPSPAVRLARRIDDELSDIDADDRSWERAQREVNAELKTLTDAMSRHGDRASAELLEDGVLVRVEYRGRPVSVPDLVDGLDAEIEDRERLLNEREREILENHLVNEVASTLQELISAAEAQVGRMNHELSNRPTSTGMQLRLRWTPRADGPAGLAEARERLLRQTSDAWSERERAAVGAFLQAQIMDVRSRDAAGTWLDQLTEALDYRSWHGFVIERRQNGQWRSAAGPASGGERVLAASVPLFAAASSHYASAARGYAPRLVLLDEAFAGVDDNARAKYLGLLTAFDLDVVMTSEREWGCYSEVPGLAIAQLARTEDVAAVLVTRWEWDGHQRTRAAPPTGQVPSAPTPEGLWQ